MRHCNIFCETIAASPLLQEQSCLVCFWSYQEIPFCLPGKVTLWPAENSSNRYFSRCPCDLWEHLEANVLREDKLMRPATSRVKVEKKVAGCPQEPVSCRYFLDARIQGWTLLFSHMKSPLTQALWKIRAIQSQPQNFQELITSFRQGRLCSVFCFEL